MAAKVDNAAIQDGYSLYHHVILFDMNLITERKFLNSKEISFKLCFYLFN